MSVCLNFDLNVSCAACVRLSVPVCHISPSQQQQHHLHINNPHDHVHEELLTTGHESGQETFQQEAALGERVRINRIYLTGLSGRSSGCVCKTMVAKQPLCSGVSSISATSGRLRVASPLHPPDPRAPSGSQPPSVIKDSGHYLHC